MRVIDDITGEPFTFLESYWKQICLGVGAVVIAVVIILSAQGIIVV